VTNQYDNDEASPPADNPYRKLSAVKPNGTMMTIEEYCEEYNLDYDNLRSYKFVMWPEPYYNIAFNSVVEDLDGFDLDEVIEEIVKKHIEPVELPRLQFEPKKKRVFDWVRYTDVHIGMDPDPEGISMYPDIWNDKVLHMRNERMIDYVIKKQKGSVLIVDDHGDLVDGMNGQTVRGGHDLPQNMSNIGQIDHGVKFKMRQIDMWVQHYELIILNNIANDNHSGDFGYAVYKTVAEVCAVKYPGRVYVKNHLSFISHYTYGNVHNVLSHGKDKKNTKFGFGVVMNPESYKKIDNYCKNYNLYDGKQVNFSKGDTHLFFYDCSSSDDFEFTSLMAFSPSSDWVKANFKKGRGGGFLLSHVEEETGSIELDPYWFEKY